MIPYIRKVYEMESADRRFDLARLVLSVTLLALVCLGLAVPKACGFGLGVILGEPTGLSFKQWLTVRTAFDGAVAWSFEDESAFHAHMDYLVHGRALAGGDVGKLLFYFGVGGRFKLEDEETRVGVRAPLGIDYVFAASPLDVFFEVAPLLDLGPSTDFRINGGIGIRYYF